VSVSVKAFVFDASPGAVAQRVYPYDSTMEVGELGVGKVLTLQGGTLLTSPFCPAYATNVADVQ